ncbi:thioredoxin-like protein hcf164 chloroplastic [Phtheirospermum japonicum]|uniref:Thioredoxin-like protein HCF164, chloroplastic n=1 Tax=Phtheirospermum japonicum TaxID=374723 RepID=A0A830CUN6_9LAMI|nr:thioredoxin-like protein hcf164 chloroplastic [Phtheirospermum japonicum]
MARVASTSSAVSLPRFHPSPLQSHHQPPRFVNFSFHFQKKNHRIICQNNPNPVDSAASEEKPLSEPESQVNGTTETNSSSIGSVLPDYPDKNFNRRIALGSTVAAVGLFLSARLDFGSISLKDLSAAALPYEQALSNGKPTVVEFYADWCEVCRELAPDVYKVEQQYKDRVNFVMLNVDNTNWEQELDEFGVEGIPHFAFLDRDGNEEGNVVGRLPKQYLLENVDALARGEATVPHARVVGQYSKAESRKVRPVVDPRSHG